MEERGRLALMPVSSHPPLDPKPGGGQLGTEQWSVYREVVVPEGPGSPGEGLLVHPEAVRHLRGWDACWGETTCFKEKTWVGRGWRQREDDVQGAEARESVT